MALCAALLLGSAAATNGAASKPPYVHTKGPSAPWGQGPMYGTRPPVELGPQTATLSAESATGLTPHQTAINQAIEDGLAWLAANQNLDGSWPASGDNFVAGAGFGAMVFMAQGYDEGDLYEGRDVVGDAMAYILAQQKPAGWAGLDYTEGSIFWGGDPPDTTFVHHANYETSVAVMALAMTGNADYDDEIAAAATWLDWNQWDDTSPNMVTGDYPSWYLGGFGYECMLGSRPDLSNSQLSIVALYAALHDLGALPSDVVEDAIEYIHNCRGVEEDTLLSVVPSVAGCVNQAKWNPAGTKIAYLSHGDWDDPEEQWTISVWDMAPADEVVADKFPAEVYRARYSAAADRVAFSTSEGELWLMAPDGTGLQQLAMPQEVLGFWDLAWSPSGDRLVINACADEDWPPDLHVYEVATQTLGPGLGINACAYGLDWSPATSGPYADKVVFNSCEPWPPEVKMVDVTTGVVTSVTGGLPEACCNSPRWSPDGTKMVFVGGGLDPDIDSPLCVINPDGTGLEVLGEGTAPVWSPDGTRIACRQDIAGGSVTTVMDADGSDAEVCSGSQGIVWIGDWRVDGDGTDWLLHAVDGEVRWLEVALPKVLGEVVNEERIPSIWSPAGDRIAFTAPHNMLDPMDPNDQTCVWVADANGGSSPQNMSPGSWSHSPTWSPDGTGIAFIGPRGHPEFLPPECCVDCGMWTVWVVDLDGGDPPKSLSDPGHCMSGPEWGAPPDGAGGTQERIAYVDANSRVWTVRPDGTDLVAVTADDGLPRHVLTWSPDSTRLAYYLTDWSAPGPLPTTLYVMDYDGGNEVAIPLGYIDYEVYSWSLDSSTIAVHSYDGSALLVHLDVSPPVVSEIPELPQHSAILDWPETTPWSTNGDLILTRSCVTGHQGATLMKAAGYVPDGGFIYTPDQSIVGGRWSTGSMTAAAVWCLRLLGVPISDPWLQGGLNWLSDNYTYEENPGGQGASMHYYYLWSAAKGFLVSDVDALPGVAHIPVDAADQSTFDPGWYYDFSKYLVEQQLEDGCWNGDHTDTYFALLILQKETGIPYAVDASLSPDTVSCAPGSPANFTLTVHNIGTEMDSYNLEVVSVPTGWPVGIAPTADDVASDEERAVPVAVTPPADLALWHDTAYTLELRVTSQTDPGISQDTSGQVIILATATAGSRYYFVNDLLDALIAEILASGLDTGSIESLVSKLETAKMHKDRALEYFEAGELEKAENRLLTAINVMEAFANEIEALREKKIPAALCDDWLSKGGDICYRLEVLRDETVPPVLPGQILFFRTPDQGATLSSVLIQPDGSGEETLPIQGAQYSWSSDNSKVAYDRAGYVWVSNADGTGEVQVTSGGSDRFPTWSPDDSEIAFCRLDADGDPQMHVVNLATSDARQLTDIDVEDWWDMLRADWSPTGEWIIYAAPLAGQGGVFEARLVRPDGSEDHTLIEDAGMPRFSRDGQKIVFGRMRPDGECGNALYLANADGSGEEIFAYRLPWGIAGCYAQFSWSPDSQYVAVWETPVVCCGGATDITVVSRNGLQVERLTDNPGVDDIAPSWSKPTFADLRDLLVRMDMTNGLRNSFIAHLDAAEADLAAGDAAAAVSHVQDFSAAAEAERYGRLRLSQVDSLMGYAASLIVKVEATS